MLRLTIPQLEEDSKNVKDLVFTILTQEQPLSIIELTNKIKKQYNLNITYQAVRKAVDSLCNQGVLTKGKKKYSISKKWILSLKSFFDRLLTTYETKTPVKMFHSELAKEDYALYTFNNLLDLDNFWAGIMEHWADHLKPGDSSTYISYCPYSFWFLINLGQETGLFEHMIKKGVKPHVLFPYDAPLNRWGFKLYKDIGAKVKIAVNKEIDDQTALNILGDNVVQVKYPPNIIKKLRKIYGKYKSVSEISPKEITQIAHEPGEIKFIMFRNPALAKDLRETYLRYF
jgi:uncharacterized protein YfkK (UPF0435 family)